MTARNRSRNSRRAGIIPLDPNTGSTITAARACRCRLMTASAASALLKGKTTTSSTTRSVIPRVAATDAGASLGPALAMSGPIEIDAYSEVPWNPPSALAILGRPVNALASRRANITASVPELANRMRSIEGTRSAIAWASAISCRVGAAKALPLATCACTAAATPGWQCPRTSAV